MLEKKEKIRDTHSRIQKVRGTAKTGDWKKVNKMSNDVITS